jgi:hypothetical protein
MDMPDSTSPPARSNPVVFTLVMTAALAGAVLAGASLTGVANGSMQDLLRGAGFGRNGEIMAEQRRQALALQKMAQEIGSARADVAALNARVDEAESLYQEAVNVASAAASGRPDPASGPPSQGRDHELDLGALRSSVDAQAEHNRNEFHAVNKRLDWLEKVIYGPEGAVQPAGTSPHRQRRQLAHGWRVLRAENGSAVISGRRGAIDVTPGSTVPDLGRIAAIRQERGRWVVVTENGMTIREQ